MSSSSTDNESRADKSALALRMEHKDSPRQTIEGAQNGEGSDTDGGRLAELLQEERDSASTPQSLGNGTSPYKLISQGDGASVSEDGSTTKTLHRSDSPIDSLLSVPDDSPSIQVSN